MNFLAASRSRLAPSGSSRSAPGRSTSRANASFILVWSISTTALMPPARRLLTRIHAHTGTPAMLTSPRAMWCGSLSAARKLSGVGCLVLSCRTGRPLAGGVGRSGYREAPRWRWGPLAYLRGHGNREIRQSRVGRAPQPSPVISSPNGTLAETGRGENRTGIRRQQAFAQITSLLSYAMWPCARHASSRTTRN